MVKKLQAQFFKLYQTLFTCKETGKFDDIYRVRGCQFF